ncbi:MAG TPA: hypothetical protein VK787_13305 [Puia sp.]|nr:hypothetical protein [Puia sp.]
MLGIFAHQKINYYAVFSLPPEMMVLYKPNIDFIKTHAVDPDKRRYVSATQGAHHHIDIDHYGKYPFAELPHTWNDAEKNFRKIHCALTELFRDGLILWNRD